MHNAGTENLKWVRGELERAGLSNSKFGDEIYNFIETMHVNTNSDVSHIKHNLNMLSRLFENRPITPLVESDFYSKIIDGRKLLVTDRYEYVYQDEDGEWYDDRAIVYIKDGNKIYLYQDNKSSKQKISLPYLPEETIIHI